MASSEAFALKGPRVALRRWFSWVHAMQFHDRVWHTRLAALLSLGMRLGVYKHWSACPVWGGPAAEAKAPKGEKESKAAADLPAPAAVEAQARRGAGSSTDGPSKDTKGQVSQNPESLEALRKRCTNTMFVAANILSRDGLQNVVRTMLLLLGPCFDAHSEHARSIRGPGATLDFFLAQSKAAWEAPLLLLCQHLQD
eukprot:9334309-Lingulodinium_polyedra.AAC.1